MLHSWNGYKKFAWGTDELQPMSRHGKNWLFQGASIIGPSSRANSAPRSLRRALLTPQANTGSLYRCGKRT